MKYSCFSLHYVVIISNVNDVSTTQMKPDCIMEKERFHHELNEVVEHFRLPAPDRIYYSMEGIVAEDFRITFIDALLCREPCPLLGIMWRFYCRSVPVGNKLYRCPFTILRP